MKWIKRIFLCFIILFFFGLCGVLSINFYVIGHSKSQILTLDEVKDIPDIDAIVVLGCQVRSDGTPSAMLEDRLNTGIQLYDMNVSPSILMSGDHSTDYYNEVQVMKDYAVEQNISAAQILMDHLGVSTYDSIYRAKEVFHLKKIVIVTQSYHLYRALYIADALGLEAYGVSSDTVVYRNQFYREVREVLARNKDFVLSFFGVKPQYKV